ncbi:acylneuraminate cytidylyltransferase family protein [bacterium]|nr:acylneuraminate cytidylyltransferase family protein [bacterium]
MKNKILYLITARSGSKSVPNKNIKILGDRELLAYRICSALRIATTENIWLSTDSIEYAKIGEKWGAKVPFLRPIELAADNTPSVDVVLHAMDFAEKEGYEYEAVCLLEPTVPFVPYSLLAEAGDLLFKEKECENVLAVKRVNPGSFFIQQDDKYLWKIAENVCKNNGVKRRQEEIPEITPSGCFYFAKWNEFKKNKSFYTDRTLSFLVDDIYCTEIDEPIDFLWSQFLLEKNLVDLEKVF